MALRRPGPADRRAAPWRQLLHLAEHGTDQGRRTVSNALPVPGGGVDVSAVYLVDAAYGLDVRGRSESDGRRATSGGGKLWGDVGQERCGQRHDSHYGP